MRERERERARASERAEARIIFNESVCIKRECEGVHKPTHKMNSSKLQKRRLPSYSPYFLDFHLFQCGKDICTAHQSVHMPRHIPSAFPHLIAYLVIVLGWLRRRLVGSPNKFHASDDWKTTWIRGVSWTCHRYFRSIDLEWANIHAANCGRDFESSAGGVGLLANGAS